MMVPLFIVQVARATREWVTEPWDRV